MTPHDLTAEIQTFVEASPLNVVVPERALRPDLIGMRLFEPPLVGVRRRTIRGSTPYAFPASSVPISVRPVIGSPEPPP